MASSNTNLAQEDVKRPKSNISTQIRDRFLLHLASRLKTGQKHGQLGLFDSEVGKSQRRSLYGIDQSACLLIYGSSHCPNGSQEIMRYSVTAHAQEWGRLA